MSRGSQQVRKSTSEKKKRNHELLITHAHLHPLCKAVDPSVQSDMIGPYLPCMGFIASTAAERKSILMLWKEIVKCFDIIIKKKEKKKRLQMRTARA